MAGYNRIRFKMPSFDNSWNNFKKRKTWKFSMFQCFSFNVKSSKFIESLFVPFIKYLRSLDMWAIRLVSRQLCSWTGTRVNAAPPLFREWKCVPHYFLTLPFIYGFKYNGINVFQILSQTWTYILFSDLPSLSSPVALSLLSLFVCLFLSVSLYVLLYVIILW